MSAGGVGVLEKRRPRETGSWAAFCCSFNAWAGV